MTRMRKVTFLAILMCVIAAISAGIISCKTDGTPKLTATVADNAEITVNSSLDDVKQYLKVAYTDNNGDESTVTDYELTGEISEGETILTVKYKGLTVSVKITVKAQGSTEPSVKAELNGGIMNGEFYVDENGYVTAPENPVKEGCVFEGWYKDSDWKTLWNFETDKAEEEVTLYAKFTPLYNVTYNANGGKLDGEKDTETLKVKKGSKIEEPAVPTKEGFLFTAWYCESDLKNEWNFDSDKVNTDITLYAGWKVREFDVTFVLNYENASDEVKSTVNGLITYSPTREGYVFNGWWLSDGQTPSGEYILSQKWDEEQTVTESGITLYAEWVEKATVSSQLPAPAVNINGAVFSWNAVNGAERYDVRVYKSGASAEINKISVDGTSYAFPSNYEAGYYTVKIRAVGDGINTVNSSYAVKGYAHMILAAVSKIDFDISSSLLTWTSVKNATSYKVYVDGVLAETVTRTAFDMSEFAAGRHEVKIVAERENYQSSEVSKTIEKKRLQSPDVQIYVDKENMSYVLMWDRVANADTYIIAYGNEEIRLTSTVYKFNNSSKLWLGENLATLKISAYDSGADYLVSLIPTEINVGKLFNLTVGGASDEAGSAVISGETFSEAVRVSQTFKITYNLNYESAGTVEKFVTSEQKSDYYVPKREGYVFNGWYTSTLFLDRHKVDFSQKITQDLTLYAKWYKIDKTNSKTVYVIDPNSQDFNSQGALFYSYSVNTTGATTSKRVDIYFTALDGEYGTTVSFIPNVNFEFWNVTQNKKSPFRQQVYGGTQYYYSLSDNDNGDVMRISFTSTCGTNGTMNLGIQLKRSNLSCDYLTYYKPSNVTDVLENVVASCGSEITLKANTEAGHAWMGWYDGETLISREMNYTFTMPSNNVNYTAKWTTVEVNGNSEVAGTFTPLNGKYVFGEEVTLTSATNDGYAWMGWYNGDTLLSSEEIYTFNIPSCDFTYTAKWQTAINYIDENGEVKTYDGADIEYVENLEGNELSRWYYVGGQLRRNLFTVRGQAHIILADGCDLYVGQIIVPVGSSLYIYAQSFGENAGRLGASLIGGLIGKDGQNGGNGNSTNCDGKTGVRGENGGNSGTIVINGGVINVSRNIGGGDGGYGGGGGSAYSGSKGKGVDGFDGLNGGNSEKIVINGGTVTAKNIGGGNGGKAGFGGSGGPAYASSLSGNSGRGGNGGNSGVIEINGGSVTADNIGGGNGGNGNSGKQGGDGGNGGACGIIIIKNGCVTQSFTSGIAGSGGKSYFKDGSYADGSAGTNGEQATVYFVGTEQQWNESLGSIENLMVYYYSADEPVSAGRYWHYDSDGGIIKW